MKHRLARVCLPLILAGAVAPPHAWPQNTVRGRTVSSVASLDSARGNFKVDSILVLVNVAVTDSRGRFVTGLSRQDFQVFEEKTAQTVAYFSAEEAPVSVGLVLDFSSSIARFGQLQQAVAEFLKSPNPQDEFCLIEFRDRAELSMGFTSAAEEIQNRVASTKPRGDTALLDAVYLGLRQMRKARNSRKILLIVSDGGDNHSRYRAREVENLARESDVEQFRRWILADALARFAQRKFDKLEAAAETLQRAEASGRRIKHEQFAADVEASDRKSTRLN